MLRQQKLEFESQASAMPARPSSHNCIVLNVLTSQYNIFDKKMFLNPRTLHCTKMTVGLVPILYICMGIEEDIFAENNVKETVL